MSNAIWRFQYKFILLVMINILLLLGFGYLRASRRSDMHKKPADDEITEASSLFRERVVPLPGSGL